MDWIAVLIAIVSSTAFTSVVASLLYRKATRRLKNAEAAQAEMEVKKDKQELIEHRCTFLEESLLKADQRDADKTAQIRALNEKLFALQHNYADLKIQYMMSRCDRRKCGRRQPPNGL